MYKITEAFCAFKDLFGPVTKVEVLDIADKDNPQHILGDKIYDEHKKRSKLSDEEMDNIFDRAGTGEHPWQLDYILPKEILSIAFSFDQGVLVKLEQFSNFNRIINFEYDNHKFSFIIVSPLLDYDENIQLFNAFIPFINKYLNNKIQYPVIDYLKTFFPSFIENKVSDVLEIVKKISMQKIEGKTVETGLIFVSDYYSFKQEYYSDLFIDICNSDSIKNINNIKQPYLEITNGKRGFVVVDNEFGIKGLFYPDDEPMGLDTILSRGRKQMSESLLVTIKGTELTRIVSKNELLLEIHNGIYRKIDYGPFYETIKKIKEKLNLKCNDKELAENIIEISYLKKGTIIVIGEEIADNSISKYNDCNMKLLVKRNRKTIFRSNLLLQLSSTDGAILMDEELIIYGYGAILSYNNSERQNQTNKQGARSLTAKMYAREHPGHCLIKISEDGPIEVYYEGKLVIGI